MADTIHKRGLIDNLGKLPIEDGSVIYAYYKDDNKAELYIDINKKRYSVSSQVDQQFNPLSKNAQSGIAISEELKKDILADVLTSDYLTKEDIKTNYVNKNDIDQEYDSTSKNAQSGIAIEQAIIPINNTIQQIKKDYVSFNQLIKNYYDKTYIDNNYVNIKNVEQKFNHNSINPQSGIAINEALINLRSDNEEYTNSKILFNSTYNNKKTNDIENIVGYKGYHMISLTLYDATGKETTDSGNSAYAQVELEDNGEVFEKGLYALGDLAIVLHMHQKLLIQNITQNTKNTILKLTEIDIITQQSKNISLTLDKKTDDTSKDWLYVPNKYFGNDIPRYHSAMVMGYKSIAAGQDAFAGGSHCYAFGNHSFAFGEKTIAFYQAVATGLETKALGIGSRAHGRWTEALGENSIALGESSKSIGHTSLAIGFATRSFGEASVSMGHGTKALGNYSISTGSRTIAGYKGYKMIGYKLSEDGKSVDIELRDNKLTEKAIDNYAVGNKVNIEANAHTYQREEITAITTNDKGNTVVTLKEVDNTEIYFHLENEDGTDVENWLYIVDKCVGEEIPQFSNAISSGIETVAAGYGAFTAGRNNKVYGNYGFAIGRETIAAYLGLATGYHTRAIGHGSQAHGKWTEALADYSIAAGDYTLAKGRCSMAMGSMDHMSIRTQALADNSIALGQGTIAGYGRELGKNAIATGYQTRAYGSTSLTLGNNTRTGEEGQGGDVGLNAIAGGFGSIAIGKNSVALGEYSKAIGYCSFIAGYYVNASNPHMVAFGRFNEDRADTLLEIGNGSNTKRKNIFEVYRNGDAKISNCLILIDKNTGKEYKIYIHDGKLQLEEVIE